jgi:tetratricopeptide (TPR) repeat protein
MSGTVGRSTQRCEARPGADPRDAADNAGMKQKPRTPEQSSSSAPTAAPSADPFKLGPIAIDLRDILGDALDAAVPVGSAASEPGEVDLSDAVTGLGAGGDAASADEPGSVFKAFHDEVSRDTRIEEAERHYKVALAYHAMNMLPEAARELEIAVRAPRLRFDAAALLARVAVQQGKPSIAIEWFERAAEAPAPTRNAARSLLYDLADALEREGERARALAVFRDLEHDDPRYRDVARRLGRLAAK